MNASVEQVAMAMWASSILSRGADLPTGRINLEWIHSGELVRARFRGYARTYLRAIGRLK